MVEILEFLLQIHPAVWLAIAASLCLGYAFGRDVEFNSRLKRAKISDHLLLDRDIQALLQEKRVHEDQLELLKLKQRELKLEFVFDDEQRNFLDVGDDSQLLDTIALDPDDTALLRSSALKGELV